jgi:hypothetical protein
MTQMHQMRRRRQRLLLWLLLWLLRRTLWLRRTLRRLR